MTTEGYSIYDESTNSLEVVRPGENMTRRIPCTNLNPSANRVHGVQIHGDEIWVLVGPPTINPVTIYSTVRRHRRWISPENTIAPDGVASELT